MGEYGPPDADDEFDDAGDFDEIDDVDEFDEGHDFKEVIPGQGVEDSFDDDFEDDDGFTLANPGAEEDFEDFEEF